MSSEFQNRLAKGLGQPAAEPHPSSDVLNAYSEHLLSEAEEQQVVAHLSACADCREVVYLANGAIEEETLPHPAVAPARRISWWTWAVPLVAVLIVGSTTFFLQSSRVNRAPSAPPPQVAQAREDAMPAKTATNTASQTSTVRPPKTSARVAGSAKDSLNRPAAEPSVALRGRDEGQLQPSDEIAGSGGAPVANVPSEQQDKAKGANLASAPRPALAAPASVISGKQTVEVTDANALVDTQDESNRIAARTAEKKEAIAGYSLAKSSLQRADAAPQWRVASDGQLQHFLLGEWKPALNTPHAEFLVVASAGNDVWAGGRKLALFHSADSGVRWEPQSLTGADGDIVSIVFSSATVGTLKTSAGTTFTTHDGGKHWIALPPASN